MTTLTFARAFEISTASQTTEVAVLPDLSWLVSWGQEIDDLQPVAIFREPHSVSGVMMALAEYL